MISSENYDILIKKLDEFIRKYYKNLIIKGLLYTLSLLLFFFLFIDILEYFLHLGIIARTIVFYTFLAVALLIICRFIMFPVLKLFGISRVINHEQAAEIIGTHFIEVKDRLLNTLQLKKISTFENSDLIEASINQKIHSLKLVSFSSAINFSGNKKYLKYALPPIFIILIILFSAPSVIKEPSERIIRHREYYEKELPFQLKIVNEKLEAFQQEDYELHVIVSGEQTPSDVFIRFDNNTYKLSKENNSSFSYIFRNLQKNIKFELYADNYEAECFELRVLPKPVILTFSIDLVYPPYINKEDESFENMGDVIIPEGTKMTWHFYTRDTDTVLFRVNETMIALDNRQTNVFAYAETFVKSCSYSVSTVNKYLKNKDSLHYTINVIPDVYPSIIVEEFRDSLLDGRIYIRGNIKDDYGFSKLEFTYYYKNISNINDEEIGKDTIIQSVSINKNLTQQEFYHYFDAHSLDIRTGDEVEYFFEIWDNDEVNGNKSTRSQKMVFRIPSQEEIEAIAEQSNLEVKAEMGRAIKELKSLQRDIDELNRNLLEKKTISWQEKQQLQDLLDRQAEIKTKIENIQRENENKVTKEQQYKEINPDILQKQKQLEDLFDQVLSDEMKKLFEELQNILDSVDKDKVNDMLEKMKLSSKDLEQELDRNLELFKRLEFEKKLTETIEKIGELAIEEAKLSNETKEGKKEDLDNLMEKQDGMNKSFEEIRQDLDDLDKKNHELDEPNQIQNTEELENNIQQQMQNSIENLKQRKMGKASQSQKDAAQQMKNLGKNLSNMLIAMQSEGLGEDIGAIREILENLIQISFDQEALIKELNIIRRNDPKYIEVVEKQKNIKDDLIMVEDSLIALSRRQIMIQSYVNKEIKAINNKVEKTIDDLNNRRIPSASMNQQYIMTSVNNLALLLDEAMQQMQQQMAQMMGTGNSMSACPSPGAGKMSAGNIRQLQEQLNKQLEQLKQGMESLKSGGSKGQKAMSEQLARLAAEQEAIRNKMQQYIEDLKEQGIEGDEGMRQIMNDMEKTETELVNKIITSQTLMRQQQILTRLLQSEKAELMREQEEKRESKEAKDQKLSNPDEFFKYKSIKSQQVELLKTIPPSLKPFYKKKVNEYLYNFELQ
ncbi:MAG: hypothetical protein NT175_08495 [Bacteroidetes bacterium]|nr:hypothetical protein [Bacteroidota bacterium]